MTIKYYIESVFINQQKKTVYVRGWSFSRESNTVSVNAVGIEMLQFKTLERADVVKKFDECTNLKCGWSFEIEQGMKGFIIQISDGYSTKIKKVNIKKEIKLSRFRSWIASIPHLRKKANRVWKEEGLFSVVKKSCKHVFGKGYRVPSYSEWRRVYVPTQEQLQAQSEIVFSDMPKISIVVPTYNTKKKFLEEMIESVISQSYRNWELCIADGASTNTEAIQLLKDYEARDDRIKVKFLDENLMIAGNTNEALSLSSGDYIGLFDHDDKLSPDALYEVVNAINENDRPDLIYTDEDKIDEESELYFGHHFKPDWSPDTMRSLNYITHFLVFKAELLKKVGGFRSHFDGSQDYDITLRMTEVADKIVHIPKVVYHWRVHSDSVASAPEAKLYAYEAAKKAIAAHLERVGLEGRIEHGQFLGVYRIYYEMKSTPLVSIIIPNKDSKADLKICIDSILNKSTYTHYEIVVVENNSTTNEIFDYYKEIEEKGVKVVHWDGTGFNYSAINNFGAQHTSGEHLILLNNDIEIITPKWIEEMLMYSMREDVGIVGAKLYYPDDTIQHAGVILGLGGYAAHSHRFYERKDTGYIGRLNIVQNLSAVTGACLMVKKTIFDEIGGLDELFAVAYNDVDLCMKVRQIHKLVVWTPFAELYHHESKSRGQEDTPEKIARFDKEKARLLMKWGEEINNGDPYYNKNLTLDREDFSLRDH